MEGKPVSLLSDIQMNVLKSESNLSYLVQQSDYLPVKK